MKKRGIIDRFEEDYAVVEFDNGFVENVEKIRLPINAKEGDIICIVNDSIIIDNIETENRKQKIERLMDELFE